MRNCIPINVSIMAAYGVAHALATQVSADPIATVYSNIEDKDGILNTLSCDEIMWFLGGRYSTL